MDFEANGGKTDTGKASEAVKNDVVNINFSLVSQFTCNRSKMQQAFEILLYCDISDLRLLFLRFVIAFDENDIPVHL